MRAAGLFLICVSLAAQQASIEGLVINQANQQPLSGVHIRLIASNMSAGITAAYGAMSDRAGHFSIADLAPGTYLVTAERTGFIYIPKDAAGPALAVKAGQQLTEYKIEMAARAGISGRVVDEYGDPVPNVEMQLTKVSGTAGAMPIDGHGRSFGITDDRGEFRLSGAPGKYYVKATPNRFPMMSLGAEVRTDGTSAALYTTTYYPSAGGTDRAVVIDAKPGADVTGLEIRLQRQRNLTISGTVSGIPAGSGGGFVVVQPGEGDRQMGFSGGAPIGPDGKFTIAQLAPGSYRIHARFDDHGTQFQSPPVDVRLDSDATVALTLAAGTEISGSVELAGDPPKPFGPENGAIRLDPMLTFGDTKTGEIGRNGEFKMTGVPPGRFRVHVAGLPENAYVKTIQVDGAIVPADTVDLTRGASKMKITIGIDGAQLSVTVTGKDGEKIDSPMAFVFLVPDGTEVRIAGEPENVARQQPDGTFRFVGLRPGKYRLVLINPFQLSGGEPEEMLKKAMEKAEVIEVKAGDRTTKEVRMPDKDEPHAK